MNCRECFVSAPRKSRNLAPHARARVPSFARRRARSLARREGTMRAPQSRARVDRWVRATAFVSNASTARVF